MMLIILKKKSGTNGFEYPGNPLLFTNQFINPDNPDELIAQNDSGRMLGDLSSSVSYAVVQYAGSLPRKTKIVGMGLLCEELTKTVLRELRAFDLNVIDPNLVVQQEISTQAILRMSVNAQLDVFDAPFIDMITTIGAMTSLGSDEATRLIEKMQT